MSLRNTQVFCPTCNIHSDLICRDDDTPTCRTCQSPLEQQWWVRRSQLETVWGKDEMAVVFRKPDGTYSFPARNDKPTPEGYERVEIRSDREMARVEREAGVQSERRWYDQGSGGSHERPLAPVPRTH